MKIVTLTFNPALDKSTSVERLTPEIKMRCGELLVEAGGGGINVSKGIHKLGGQSTAVFPVAGLNGQRLKSILRASGIDLQTLEITGETRENFSFLETGSNQQYRFTMSGQALAEADADALLDQVRQLKPAILVASGSLPQGLPATYYEKVAVLAKELDTRFVLDTSGPALQAAADTGLFLLKPNLAELSALVGKTQLEMNEVDDAAMHIIEQGKCEMVVVSLGPQGALLATREGFEHIPAPPVKKQTTVGAGDSMVAGMVWALAAGKTPREMAQFGVACGTAATLNQGTELFHPADVWRLVDWIKTYGERYRFTDF
ncbi:MAG: 1-phosphofructokinase family hexose kinase [Saprospiraceae bacterium]|nr:1-phosphofructokinase family hexose kinase [Saprospiraceae bacterium]